MVLEAQDSVVTREVPLEKNVGMKRSQKYSKDDKETVCSYHVHTRFTVHLHSVVA